jgi:hypothetical protein
MPNAAYSQKVPVGMMVFIRARTVEATIRT